MADDDDDFEPTDQRRHTAQTSVSRNVIQNFYHRRSDMEGFKQLIFYLSTIVVAQVLLCKSTGHALMHCMVFFAYGYVLSFLFMGLHEMVHRTAFATRSFNDVVAYIFGFACFRPPTHYRYYHWAHHRFTGNKAKDPELQNTWIDFDIANSWLNYVAYMTAVPFWIDRICTLLRHSSLFIVDSVCDLCRVELPSWLHQTLLPTELEYYLQRKQRRYTVALEAFVFMVIYVVIGFMLDTWLLCTYWLLPSLIGQVFLRAYLLAEHRECHSEADMLTQTFWLERTLAWNMPYHLEHHAFPYIPFYLLPEMHRNLIQQCGGIEGYYAKSKCVPSGKNGYLSVHRKVLSDILRKMQTKKQMG